MTDEDVPSPWRERIEELKAKLTRAQEEVRDMSENHYKLLQRIGQVEARLGQSEPHAEAGPTPRKPRNDGPTKRAFSATSP